MGAVEVERENACLTAEAWVLKNKLEQLGRNIHFLYRRTTSARRPQSSPVGNTGGKGDRETEETAVPVRDVVRGTANKSTGRAGREEAMAVPFGRK